MKRFDRVRFASHAVFATFLISLPSMAGLSNSIGVEGIVRAWDREMVHIEVEKFVFKFPKKEVAQRDLVEGKWVKFRHELKSPIKVRQTKADSRQKQR